MASTLRPATKTRTVGIKPKKADPDGRHPAQVRADEAMARRFPSFDPDWRHRCPLLTGLMEYQLMTELGFIRAN